MSERTRKPTGGIWKVVRSGDKNKISIVAQLSEYDQSLADGLTIADVRVRKASLFEDLSNARLMAAAPELLAVLQSYVPEHISKTGHEEWCGRMTKAISKATQCSK